MGAPCNGSAEKPQQEPLIPDKTVRSDDPRPPPKVEPVQASTLPPQTERGGSESMKVLIYSHSFFPTTDGVSVRYQYLVKCLVRAGHTVFIATIEKQLNAEIAGLAEGVCVLQSRGALGYDAKKLAEPSVSNLIRLSRFAMAITPDVIHVTMCPSLPVFLLVSKITSVPLVLCMHTDAVVALKKAPNTPRVFIPAVDKSEALCSWLADATFTTTKSFAQVLKRRRFSLLDVYFGGLVDPVVFSPHRHSAGVRDRLTFGHPSDFLVVCVGRVSWEKNIQFAVDLVQAHKHRGVWLAIIGDGPAAPDFAEQHGERNHVYFHPKFVAPLEVAEAIASADMLVSASEFESTGFTAIEAMACGTPVLVADAQGFRDIVPHGVGGFRFQPKSLESASQFLDQLLTGAVRFEKDSLVASTANMSPEASCQRALDAWYQAMESHATNTSLVKRAAQSFILFPLVSLVNCLWSIGFLLNRSK